MKEKLICKILEIDNMNQLKECNLAFRQIIGNLLDTKGCQLLWNNVIKKKYRKLRYKIFND